MALSSMVVLRLTTLIAHQVRSGAQRKKSAEVWGLDFEGKKGRVSKKRSGQLKGFGVHILTGNSGSAGDGVGSGLGGAGRCFG